LRLEVGPGFSFDSRGYRFRPRIPPLPDAVYLDVQPPQRNPCVFWLCDWIVADAQLLPFRSNSFEEIYASHVIEHLADPMAFLLDAYRVLRAGGRIHIWAPNFLSRSAYEDPDHKHVFTPLGLRRMLRSAGFATNFYPSAGSLIPNPASKLLRMLLLMLLDEINVTGIKRV